MPNTGDLITIGSNGFSGAAPGQNTYNMSGKQGTVLGTRSVGGQNYYNVDFSKAPGGAGQGTGWVSANSLGGGAPASTPTFNSPQSATADLNNFQQAQLNNTVPGVQSTGDVKANLEAQLPHDAPAPIDWGAQFTQLSTEHGLDTLQKNINDLSAQETGIHNQLRTNQGAEQGKPVAQNVIDGRMTEEQRQANEQLSYIGQQKQQAVDQYNSALTTVQTIMNNNKLTYDEASQNYNQEYTKAINMINMVQGVQKDQMTMADQARTSATANLQVIMNSIKDGSGASFAQMPPEEQAQINKLELQAGLPMGFVSSIQKDPKADIVTMGSNNGQIQVLLKQPDGSMKLQTYGSKNATTSSGTPTTNKYLTQASKYLDQQDTAFTGKGTADKLLSRAEQEAAFNQILALVGGNQATAKDVFQQAFDAGGYGNYGN